MNGIYIHVPFCVKICDYCDFSALAAPVRMYGEYVDLLLQEAKLRFEKCKKFISSLNTAYFGGGTPSLLPEKEFARLVEGLTSLGVHFEQLKEVSLECNPDSVSLSMLENAASLGVNRFSLGIQTFDDRLLKNIGRRQTAALGRESLFRLNEFAQKRCFRVSADLMFQLPGQTLESFLSDVRELAKTGIGHVSFYGLTVSPNSVLATHLKKGLFTLPEDLYADMYEGGVEVLKEFGLERYEVSNFARKGEESLHNLNYWKRGEYLGLGPGAHGFQGNVRTAAPYRYSDWRNWVKRGCPDEGLLKDVLGRKERIEEFIWLSLRTSNGLDLRELLEKESFLIPENKICSWVDRNFLAREGSRIFLVGQGWTMMDAVVEDFLP